MEPHQQAGGWSSVPSAAPPPLPSPAPHNPSNIDSALHQSLVSHFHLLHLIENLAEAIESGVRDQHSDSLKGRPEECVHLLSYHSLLCAIKKVKRKRCMDLISQYKGSVEDLIKAYMRKS